MADNSNSLGTGLMAVFAVSGSVALLAMQVHKRLLSDFMKKMEFEIGSSKKLNQSKNKKVRFADSVEKLKYPSSSDYCKADQAKKNDLHSRAGPSSNIVLRAPPSYVDRRQPLLISQQEIGGSKRVAEVLGGTAAECAAICCCCPCGLVNLLVLAVYKVPAGLCRKALRKKRQRRRKLMMNNKEGLLPPRKCGCDDVELVQLHPLPGPLLPAVNSDKDVVELEK
ncbi:hypothetical protein ACH5RR_004460, partial [Cinchona calisaya]